MANIKKSNPSRIRNQWVVESQSSYLRVIQVNDGRYFLDRGEVIIPLEENAALRLINNEMKRREQ